MNSKYGDAGATFIFESKKRHGIQPLKTDKLTVNAFNAFIRVHDELPQSPISIEEISIYTMHIILIIYHFTQCILTLLSLSFDFGVRSSKMFAVERYVLKCFMTSIHRQSSEKLTFSFVKTLPPVTVVCQCIRYQCFILLPNDWVVFKICFAILHNIVARNNIQPITFKQAKGKKLSFYAFALHPGSPVTHPGCLL